MKNSAKIISILLLAALCAGLVGFATAWSKHR